MLKLYSYWRSSSSYRVRIALALKNLDCEIIPVHLVRDGGEQNAAEFRRINPLGYVPCLIDGPVVITQSMAIIDYLNAAYPPKEPARSLLPDDDPVRRAKILSFAMTIIADVQPLQNISVLNHVVQHYDLPGEERIAWSKKWIERGFTALETVLSREPETLCCFGEHPTVADVVLVPQMYNARRFGVDLTPYPNLVRAAEHCEKLPAFMAAHPDQQPDAQAV